MAKRSRKEENGLGKIIDNFLIGESGKPVNVVVEKVKKTPDLVIKHNLETLGDFGPIDFFMPLILMLLIMFLSILGPSLYALIVQVYLVIDLLKRVRRRPSGLKVVGLVPPYKDGNWLLAFGVYLVALPAMLAAAWLNRLLVSSFYTPQPLFGPNSGSLFAVPGFGAFIAIGLGIILFIFFQTVIFAPITEEIWFRGIGLAGFLKNNNSRSRSILWTSLIFGVLHGLTRIFDATLFGFVASFIRYRTGSIYCCIAVHMFHNFVVTLLMLYAAYVELTGG